MVLRHDGFKYAFFRVSLCAGAIFGSIVVSELIIRFCVPQPISWLDIYQTHPSLPFYSLRSNVQRDIDTGETKWTVYTDDQGFRTASAADRTAQPPSALVLGDSFAFGVGVNYEESFVGLLNSIPNGNRHYLNASLGGWGPRQYRQLLEYLLGAGLSPELVIVATYVGNDFYDCIWNKNRQVVDGIIGNRRSFRGTLKRNSHLYRLLSKAYHKVGNKHKRISNLEKNLYDEEKWNSGGLKNAYDIYRNEFEAISRICKENSLPLFVIVIPTRESVANNGLVVPADHGGVTLRHDLPMQKVGSILTSLDIRYKDMTPELKKLNVAAPYFVHDSHLTPRGHKIVYEAILDLIASCGMK